MYLRHVIFRRVWTRHSFLLSTSPTSSTPTHELVTFHTLLGHTGMHQIHPTASFRLFSDLWLSTATVGRQADRHSWLRYISKQSGAIPDRIQTNLWVFVCIAGFQDELLFRHMSACALEISPKAYTLLVRSIRTRVYMRTYAYVCIPH